MRANFVAAAVWLATAAAAIAQVPGEFLGRAVNEEAPAEVRQWAQILGDWEVRWTALNDDGTVQGRGTASWHWYAALDGLAIQDFWVQPADGAPGRMVGTNLRTFNTDTGLWDIRSTFGRSGFEEFTARNDEDRIVMNPVGQEKRIRMTFLEMGVTGFRLIEEKSDDGGATWRIFWQAWMTPVGAP